MIESCTCLCARRASARDVIFGKGRHLALKEASNGVFFGAEAGAAGELLAHEESVGGYGQGGMVMESPPAASFVVTQPQFLLELLVVRSMRQRRCATRTSSLSGVCSGSVESQYLVGSGSFSGHSMSSHRCGRSRARPRFPPATCTRATAKRSVSVSLVPSR